VSVLDTEALRLKLIRGGVAAKYVSRTVEELKAHFEDLVFQCSKEGISKEEAQSRALQSLGDVDVIATEVLAKPELRTYTWRHPIITFILGPVAVSLISYLVSFLLIVGIFTALPGIANMNPQSDPPMLMKLLLHGITWFNVYVLTPLIAVLFVRWARNHYIKNLWPAIGIVVVAALGSGWGYELEWPTELARGSLSLSWGYSFLPHPVSMNHDWQNYLLIALTLAASIVTWRFYNPAVVSPDISD